MHLLPIRHPFIRGCAIRDSLDSKARPRVDGSPSATDHLTRSDLRVRMRSSTLALARSSPPHRPPTLDLCAYFQSSWLAGAPRLCANHDVDGLSQRGLSIFLSLLYSLALAFTQSIHFGFPAFLFGPVHS